MDLNHLKNDTGGWLLDLGGVFGVTEDEALVREMRADMHPLYWEALARVGYDETQVLMQSRLVEETE